MSAAAPTIESDRLILRPPALDDYADCVTLWGDPDVTRYIGGRPFSAEESWHRLLRYVGHWQLFGYGFWMAIDKATGRRAGDVGLGDFKRALDPPQGDLPYEIGWVLAPWAHGRGLGTEAVRTALAWRDQKLPGDRTTCIINPDNAPSLRVADKCGFRQHSVVRYAGHETLLFERFK